MEDFLFDLAIRWSPLEWMVVSTANQKPKGQWIRKKLSEEWDVNWFSEPYCETYVNQTRAPFWLAISHPSMSVYSFSPSLQFLGQTKYFEILWNYTGLHDPGMRKNK